MKEYLEPEEQNVELLRLYYQSLYSGTLRPNWSPVLYIMAVHHVNRFMYTQDGSHAKFKASMMKNLFTSNNKVTIFAKIHKMFLYHVDFFKVIVESIHPFFLQNWWCWFFVTQVLLKVNLLYVVFWTVFKKSVLLWLLVGLNMVKLLHSSKYLLLSNVIQYKCSKILAFYWFIFVDTLSSLDLLQDGQSDIRAWTRTVLWTPIHQTEVCEFPENLSLGYLYLEGLESYLMKASRIQPSGAIRKRLHCTFNTWRFYLPIALIMFRSESVIQSDLKWICCIVFFNESEKERLETVSLTDW